MRFAILPERLLHMKKSSSSFCLLVALAMLVVSSPVAAASLFGDKDNAKPSTGNDPVTPRLTGSAAAGASLPVPNIFGYPGSTCPAGSQPIHGPEQAVAADSGTIYCKFFRTSSVLDKKKSGGQCPEGMKFFDDGKHKPPEGSIWCVPQG